MGRLSFLIGILIIGLSMPPHVANSKEGLLTKLVPKRFRKASPQPGPPLPKRKPTRNPNPVAPSAKPQFTRQGSSQRFIPKGSPAAAATGTQQAQKQGLFARARANLSNRWGKKKNPNQAQIPDQGVQTQVNPYFKNKRLDTTEFTTQNPMFAQQRAAAQGASAGTSAGTRARAANNASDGATGFKPQAAAQRGGSNQAASTSKAATAGTGSVPVFRKGGTGTAGGSGKVARTQAESAGTAASSQALGPKAQAFLESSEKTSQARLAARKQGRANPSTTVKGATDDAATPATRLRTTTYNADMRWRDEAVALQKAHDMVNAFKNNPKMMNQDVIALQELTHPGAIKIIRERLGDSFELVIDQQGVMQSGGGTVSRFIKSFGGNTKKIEGSGVALLVNKRHKNVKSGFTTYSSDAVARGKGSTKKGAAHAEVVIDGKKIQFDGVHFDSGSTKIAHKQADEALGATSQMSDDATRIVAGDFNQKVATSETFGAVKKKKGWKKFAAKFGKKKKGKDAAKKEKNFFRESEPLKGTADDVEKAFATAEHVPTKHVKGNLNDAKAAKRTADAVDVVAALKQGKGTSTHMGKTTVTVFDKVDGRVRSLELSSSGKIVDSATGEVIQAAGGKGFQGRFISDHAAVSRQAHIFDARKVSKSAEAPAVSGKVNRLDTAVDAQRSRGVRATDDLDLGRRKSGGLLSKKEREAAQRYKPRAAEAPVARARRGSAGGPGTSPALEAKQLPAATAPAAAPATRQTAAAAPAAASKKAPVTQPKPQSPPAAATKKTPASATQPKPQSPPAAATQKTPRQQSGAASGQSGQAAVSKKTPAAQPTQPPTRRRQRRNAVTPQSIQQDVAKGIGPKSGQVSSQVKKLERQRRQATNPGGQPLLVQ